MANSTVPDNGQWNSKPAWKLPGWCEPVMVASILFFAMFMTRKRNYSPFARTSSSPSSPRSGYLDAAHPNESLDRLLDTSDSEADSLFADNVYYPTKNPNTPKVRSLGCCTVTTPSTTRFRNHIHSRILQRFPFLIEMFYWVINYAFYRMTAVASAKLFAGRGIWDVAQEHGIAVLEAEEYGLLSFLFPVREREVQQWFMHGHQDALTVLNKCYALIHIPGTVGFICWYYYVAPSFSTFATARRTLTLTNLCAFVIFVIYPCMPPRLLPAEYGFLDTVRHDDAQSVWMSGKFVNQLAAMPSMHFGYAFCIGMTLIYHSGLFRRTLEPGEARKNALWKAFYLLLGIGYPAFILTVIVATANHYLMDALVAACFVALSFVCNKAFYALLPLEDWLLWAIRAHKPVPTTGERFSDRAGRL